MGKDFERWANRKQELDTNAKRPFYHAREIWWSAVGTNVGNEIDGTGREYDRPLIILRAFNAETFLGIALTGHHRSGRYYFPLGKIGDRDASANLSQVRLYDTKRLIRKIGTLEERTFHELARAVTLTIFPFLDIK